MLLRTGHQPPQFNRHIFHRWFILQAPELGWAGPKPGAQNSPVSHAHSRDSTSEAATCSSQGSVSRKGRDQARRPLSQTPTPLVKFEQETLRLHGLFLKLGGDSQSCWARSREGSPWEPPWPSEASQLQGDCVTVPGRGPCLLQVEGSGFVLHLYIDFQTFLSISRHHGYSTAHRTQYRGRRWV